MGIIKLFTLIVILLFFSSLEMVIPFIKRAKSSLFINLSLASIGGGLGMVIYYFFSERIFPLPQKNTPFTVLNLAVTVLSLDLLSYNWHMVNHRLSLLWRFHRCHHTEQYMDASSALRFHFVETGLGLILKISFIMILKMDMASVFCFEVLYLICNIFQHSNIKIPKSFNYFFQYIFVTPSMHRAHHDLNYNRQNSNFSTIFSFWDRLFRTYFNNNLDQVREFGVCEIKTPLRLNQLMTLPFNNQPSSNKIRQ